MTPAFTLSCMVFLLYLLALPASADMMFSDPDTYWHIATGDLIRQLGTLPTHDPWSLSPGEKHWFITSWGWDAIASYIYEHYGWHGVIALNSLTIAATLAVLFATCRLRCRDGISAFFATLLAAACLFDYSVRPHQIGLLFIAILMLLLTHIRNHQLRLRWLLAIPVMIVVWVNLYSGFIIGFFLMGFFVLEALLQRDWDRLALLTLTCVLSLLACLINPLGYALSYDLFGYSRDPSMKIIQEWQGVQFSEANSPIIFYLIAFIGLIMMKRQPLAPRERWISYTCLLMGLMSLRHLRLFAIVSAPLLSLAIHRLLAPKQYSKPLSPFAQRLCHIGTQVSSSNATIGAMVTLSLAASLWLFTASASHLYHTEHFDPLPDLSGEIAYLEKSQPQARLLNTYNLGGPLILLTHGKIKVFIDGRAGTAYSNHIINDYIAFSNAKKGWLDLFDRYQLDGVMIYNQNNEIIDRFTDREGWQMAFKGKTATIFLRATR